MPEPHDDIPSDLIRGRAFEPYEDRIEHLCSDSSSEDAPAQKGEPSNPSEENRQMGELLLHLHTLQRARGHLKATTETPPPESLLMGRPQRHSKTPPAQTYYIRRTLLEILRALAEHSPGTLGVHPEHPKHSYPQFSVDRTRRVRFAIRGTPVVFPCPTKPTHRPKEVLPRVSRHPLSWRHEDTSPTGEKREDTTDKTRDRQINTSCKL